MLNNESWKDPLVSLFHLYACTTYNVPSTISNELRYIHCSVDFYSYIYVELIPTELPQGRHRQLFRITTETGMPHQQTRPNLV